MGHVDLSQRSVKVFAQRLEVLDSRPIAPGLVAAGILAPVKRVIVLVVGGLALAGCGSSGPESTTSTPVATPATTNITTSAKPTTPATSKPPKHTTTTTPKATTPATHTVETTSRVEEIENELRAARESLARASTEEEHSHIEGEISKYERELSEAKH
jgi:hypothetical protein